MASEKATGLNIVLYSPPAVGFFSSQRFCLVVFVCVRNLVSPFPCLTFVVVNKKKSVFWSMGQQFYYCTVMRTFDIDNGQWSQVTWTLGRRHSRDFVLRNQPTALRIEPTTTRVWVTRK